MPRPLCVKCQVEYWPAKNDIVVEEMASFGSYKLWCADLWECPKCHHQIISGYGNSAYAEHWQADFWTKLANARKRGTYLCFEYKDPEPEVAVSEKEKTA